MMRIVSWNLNGIRAASGKGFLEWLAGDSPDILCVQETKAEPGQLPDSLKLPLDKNGVQYTSFWANAKKRGYSGVAIYTKQKPLDVTFLDNAEFDNEGRVLKADYGAFVLICAYFPNSQDAGARLDYKLGFCAAMLSLCKKLVEDKRNLILCGDYNIAHRPVDLARPKENEGNPGYLPEERAWMDEFCAAGFSDSFRAKNGDIPGQYSWWSYRAGARARNVGWRIDYHCVNEAFLPCIESASIRQEVLGSDHCPVEILLNTDLFKNINND
ncbi:MAG: exodeoxyribonuclease III [Spirochaetaceae bacterium]|nr:exodeoxyribonuclease III [Spirochaetaceae bacterium]